MASVRRGSRAGRAVCLCVSDMSMARYGWIFGAAVVAFASSRASADLRVPTTVGVGDAVLAVELEHQAPVLAERSVAGSSLVAELPVAGASPDAHGPIWVAPPEAVLELPPAPGSAALFLSAMVSLGAWQLVRSSRDLHLGTMPEWYHTGAPAQVGHTTVFDLEFSVVALCVFDAPTPVPAAFDWLSRESRPRCLDQHILSQADPRGPPLLDS